METVEREPWVTYLEGDVIGKDTLEGARVYQVVVRVRGEGLLAVVKARKGEQYCVCFVGAATLKSLAGKVRNAVISEEGGWRDDMYPPS